MTQDAAMEAIQHIENNTKTNSAFNHIYFDIIRTALTAMQDAPEVVTVEELLTKIDNHIGFDIALQDADLIIKCLARDYPHGIKIVGGEK